MTENALRERLSQVKCFMLDMDGTFYLGDRLLDGSLDFLDALERTGRRVLFVTNNSSKSADRYVEKLRGMGVREPFLNVLTSGQAAGHYCLRTYPGQKAFLLGMNSCAPNWSGWGWSSTTSIPTMCSSATIPPLITKK